MTQLVLAPMEGLVDWRVRQLLSATGGFDLCVTEFIRVSQNLFPAHVFHRYCSMAAKPFQACRCWSN